MHNKETSPNAQYERVVATHQMSTVKYYVFILKMVLKVSEVVPEVSTLKAQTLKIMFHDAGGSFCLCAVLLCGAVSVEKMSIVLCRQAQSTDQGMSKEGMGLICHAGIP